MKIAYLVNQYPKVSHTFIRREILALEQQGFDVLRISIRGWDLPLVDDEDFQERQKTKYVLRGGLLKCVAAVIRALGTRPMAFIRALSLAMSAGRHAERPLPYHLIYLAEACLINEWLKNFGASHVHAHFGTNSAEVAMLVNALGGPSYSFTVHGPDEFDKPEFLSMREKISRATFVVAITSFCKSQLFRWATYADWQKIKVIHCGIEPHFHVVTPVTRNSVSRLICVGRLCEQKGQLLLISAVKKIVNKGIPIELVLAGDGEMRGEIERLILTLGLEAHVRITGWISSQQVRDEISAARALVLASFAEGLPVVIMEAMSLGRPVITTYIAGIPELVLNDVNGWLFAPGDIDALAEAMEIALLASEETLDAMGHAGRERVLNRHSIDTEVKKLGILFKTIPQSARELDKTAALQ